MPNITSVGITAGLGTSGTGTISTLDNLVGVAGTPSAQVQTVQGVTSMTALKVDGSAVTQPVSLASTTITGTAAVTQSGTWTVQPGNTANTTAWKVDGSAVTQPVSLAAETTKVIGVVRTADGAGNLLTSTGNAIDINIKSGGNANGQATMSASAPVTLASDQSSIATYNKVLATTNGLTSSRVDAAASTNATSLKASAGSIASIDVFNVAAYSVFLKLYNKASAPTVGTDTPVWTIPIAAGTGFSRSFLSGKFFSTGVAYAITKLQADSDTTVLVAHDLTGTIDWI